MFPGIDPEKMKAVQQISSQVKSTIRTDFEEKTITISFVSTSPQGEQFITNNILASFPSMFAQQLSTFFQIKGELINVNRSKT